MPGEEHCILGEMKKLLLLLVLFLMAPATAEASSLDTYEYRQLEAYVDYLGGLASASDQQKASFRATLRLRRDDAYESIGLAFEQAITGFYRERGSQTRRAFRRADRDRSRAKRKARRWYRQNKSRPAARKIFRKKIRRSSGRISRRLAGQLIIIEENFQSRRYNLIDARTLQNRRVSDLYQEGLSLIDNLPPIAGENL